MYISNGFVCGGTPSVSIRLSCVKPLRDMMMLLTFTTGETRLFDASILTGPIFEPLKNPVIFSKCEVDHGVATWMDGDIDCAPEYMYEHSFEYSVAS